MTHIIYMKPNSNNPKNKSNQTIKRGKKKAMGIYLLKFIIFSNKEKSDDVCVFFSSFVKVYIAFAFFKS